jgi:glycosyltransferase involved in cell wall biosynthesis
MIAESSRNALSLEQLFIDPVEMRCGGLTRAFDGVRLNWTALRTRVEFAVAFISVIICAHNPRQDALRRVLDSLAAQTLSKEKWELLLVDNASGDQLATRWPLSWHPNARHVREDQLGLTPARLRGIREARGDVLVYVDDDNVVAADYLETAQSLLLKHPQLGVIGAGTLAPEFATQPSPELLPYLGFLTLRQVSTALWSNNPDDHAAVPWGAGLCVTRGVADAYEQLVRRLNGLNVDHLLDRRGLHLFGDGDVAFSWASAARGLGFGVFPELHVTHLISADRVSQGYFLRLAQDSGLSGGVFYFLRTGLPPGDGLGSAERYLRLLLRGMRKGLFAMRLGLAVSRGEDQARAFIARQRLDHVTFFGRDAGRSLDGATLL